MTELDKIVEQQLNNYKLAVSEIIKNNTKSLVEDDIMQLIHKPPLDSMDMIKSKFLAVAKKEKIIVKTENMDSIIERYREKLGRDLRFIKKFRAEELIKDTTSFTPERATDVIRITKKQLTVINKKINGDIKKIISNDITKLLTDQINKIYSIEEDSSNYKKIFDELVKYFKNTYQKQLIESMNFKILVKDTILINSVKEQGERYLFTKNHSRINSLIEEDN